MEFGEIASGGWGYFLVQRFDESLWLIKVRLGGSQLFGFRMCVSVIWVRLDDGVAVMRGWSLVGVSEVLGAEVEDGALPRVIILGFVKVVGALLRKLKFSASRF
ncbi:hypothetical protein DITRI_Ditri06bG0096400 [Diplodiscus trichospermus]